MMRAIILSTVSFFISSLAFADSTCEFRYWTDYKNTRLKSHSTASAYLFSTSHMQIDADGAPNAYHPNDNGLDYLANAGYPNSSWWSTVLVVDPNKPNQAYVQTSGEYAGYFISKTSLQDKSKKNTDTTRYVNANNTPYLVFPSSFLRMKGSGRLGDLGIAFNPTSGNKVAFVVADVGPADAKLGEVSIALAQGLGGINVNPKNGSGLPKGEMLYVVFPNSSRVYPWPLNIDKLNRQANVLLEAIGGEESVLACRDDS